MVCIIWSCTFQHGPFGVGWWGGFYSHSVYTRPLARLEPAHWCFIYFKRCIPNNLAFRRNTLGLHYVIEGSPFSSCCPTFKALKLSTTFMIVLLMFSERGIKRFWKTCWIYPRELASFIPSNIFGGLCSCFQIVLSLHDRLAAFSLVRLSLVLRSLSGFFWSSQKDFSAVVSGVPGSLHCSFYFHRFMMNTVYMGYLPSLRWDFSFRRLYSCSVRRIG